MGRTHLFGFIITLGISTTLLGADRTIDFSLDRPATTSAGIYNTQGELVRALWQLEHLDAGKYSRTWDGKDAVGHDCPAGTYTYKVLANRATYTNIGAIGNSGRPPDAANHTPAHMASVAVDSEGNIYTANGWDEAGADFKRWDPSGKSVYDANFQIRNGQPNGAPYSIATDDQYLYCGMGGWAGEQWKEAQQIQRFRLKEGKEEKFTGTGRADGHIQLYEFPSKQIPPGTSDADADRLKLPIRALAVVGGSIYACDGLGNRIVVFDKVTGRQQREWKVENPQAIAADGEKLWVGHDGHVITQYTTDGAKGSDAVSDIGQVQAIAIGLDRRMYVADSAAGHVAIYGIDKGSAKLVRTLGEKAKRGDRDPSHFFNLHGVAVDREGNVVTIQDEPSGGARLARWAPDGQLRWEQFGCEFVSLGNYGVNAPDQFFSMTQHAYRLGDRAKGQWEYTGDAFVGPKNFTTDVHGVPRVLTLGQHSFYFLPSGDGVQVYRIDGKILRLCSILGGRSPGPNGEKETKELGQWTWHDASGTGEPRPQDIHWFAQPGKGHYACFGMDVDQQGNIWFADTSTQSIREVPIGPADAAGNPTYDWKDAREVVAKDTSSFKFEPNMVQHADDGTLYAFGWSKAWPQPQNNPFWMGGTTLVHLDGAGKRLWAAPLRAMSVGMDVVPGGGGCVVGQGKDAVLDHYSADGLLIGSMQPGEAMSKQTGWLDNHASVAVNRDPRDHWVDVFAEDDYVLRIGWYRFDAGQLQTIAGKIDR